jgi:surface polysaccharide O-acyltransferase-like enzyme
MRMKKDSRISLIRMLCTTMVVTLHITQQYEVVFQPIRYVTEWLNLGLVMFFCISAYLYSKREITSVPKWYLHRYIEIAVPSLLVGGCTLAVFAVKGQLSGRVIWATVLSCMGLEAYAPHSWMFVQLWFLTYILFFYLTVPLIQKINCKKSGEIGFWGIFVGILVATQVASIGFERVTGIEVLSVGILLRLYLPYFLFRRYDIAGKQIQPIMYIITALAAAMIAVTCIVRYFYVSLLPSGLVELIFIYTQSVAGTALFYWLYQAMEKLKGYPWILKISDMLSYEVYLTHCLFIGYATSLIVKYNYKWYGVAFALAMTVISSFALHYVAKPIKHLLSGRK